MAENDLINAFDDCLNRIRRDESIEACIATYPAYAARLRSLLETTELVKQARVDSMEVVYVQNRMRVRVAEAVRTKIQPRDPVAQRLNRIAAFLVFIMLICLIMGIFLLQNQLPQGLPATAQTITASSTDSSMPTSTVVQETATRQPVSATPSNVATQQPISVTPSDTVTPSPSITVAATSTTVPEICMVTPTGSFNVRIRSGGSTAFPAIGELAEGTSLVVVGSNAANGGWYAVEMLGLQIGWVASSVVETGGNCTALRQVTYQPMPTSVSPTSDSSSSGNSNTNDNSGNSNDNDDDDDDNGNDNDDDDNDNNGNSGSD